MANPSKEKGDRAERDLIKCLYARNYAVMRAPGSGSGTDRELPDVFAGNSHDFYAIESKCSGGDPIYLDQEEIENLLYFARMFGAVALVSAKFDLEQGDPPHGNGNDPGFRFFHPHDLHETKGGNRRIKKETAYRDGAKIDLL